LSEEMATIMIAQPLRPLISLSSIARISAGVTTVIGVDAAPTNAFSILGRQQLVPSGVRGPVRRRSVMMGLNDGKRSVLLIAGSRYAAR